MKNDIGMVYDELSALLNDICDFLSNEAGQLSPKAAAKASQLINRSKTKLVQISLILPDNDSNRYMDMTQNVNNIPEYFDPDAKPKPEEPVEIYSDIDAQQEKQSENKITCPYQALAAKDLPNDKIGYIDRKAKFLFIEHFKKHYAGIIDDWMLLYYSEKDCKPFECIHLKEYETKFIEKKEVAFELIPKQANGRIHTFSALTHKDMLQWVAVINRGSTKNFFPISKPLPKTPSGHNHAKTMEEPEIYEELGNESINQPKSPSRKCSAEENYDFLDCPEDIYDHINGPENGYDSEDIYDTITPISLNTESTA